MQEDDVLNRHTNREQAIEFMKTEVSRLRKANLDWKIHVLDGPSKARSTVDGKKDVIILCSNNYLGLADHPKLKEAVVAATSKYGAGSGSVRVIAGTMRIHL